GQAETQRIGADALRFCLTAMAAQGRDIRLSDERIEGYRNFATKIWNATRYCEMNGCIPNADFKPENAKATINKWIVGAVMDAQKSIDQNMAEYRFNDAAASIYQFVWGTFCDWYLEFTKPLLGEQNSDAALKQETRDTTGWVLDQILTLLNPFMPYITEELYESIAVRPKDQLLMGQKWPTYAPSLYSEDARAEIDWMIRLITEIRSVRSDMNVPAGAKIQMMIKDANATTQSRLAAYDEIICRMARIEKIQITDSAPKGSIQTILDEATIILPIAEIIDLDKERDRLKKEIDKLAANIDRIDQKLSDEKFVSNAPEEIVAEQKARRFESETVMRKLSQALKQLEAA
ncbi:MAG TPA: class I tRNA ligase family protein, partial [Alphaproteobacteria bacterium]|nr:class I tRNA ligase family protein [Alphaproteobacteria bacterium]